MLAWSLCWRAAARPRHTWMALMVDECSVMALPAISAFVQVTFAKSDSGEGMLERKRVTPDHPSQSSSTESAPAAAASSSTAAPGRAPAERAHAWVAVARLLCEGGDWARAAAVVDGLPPSFQQPARLKAVRDDWPLPRTVAEAWRQGAKAAEKPPASSASVRVTDVERRTTTATTGNAEPSAMTAAKKRPYSTYRSDELVRMAYGLRRPAPSAAASFTALQKEQHAIVAELRRRNTVDAALQCVANWQRRQLLRPEAEAVDQRRATTTAATSNSDLLLFDGLGAAKALLFPGTTSAAAGGVTAAFTAGDGRAGEPPRYSTQQLMSIEAAAAAHPALVARCLRDRAVGDRLLRHGGDAKVAAFVFAYLQAVAAMGTSTAIGMTPPRGIYSARSAAAAVTAAPPLTSAAGGGGGGDAAELVETYWRALATLLPLLHPYWRSQSKAEKERLVQAFSSALDATAKKTAMSGMGQAAGPQRTRSSETEKSVDSLLPPPALSEKCRRAIKASTESVCAPLLHHEPQVRFLRLRSFGDVAQRLVALHVPIPNALMQCLLLCMADTSSFSSLPSLPTHPNSGHNRDQEATPSTTATVASGNRAMNADDGAALRAFLCAVPSDRWVPALAMLHTAHRRRDFRVTATHERALLCGLQSVSITKTWASALRVVEECEKAFHATPDERTLPTLLLNLKQHSWQDAFRVLQYVPGGDPSAASPLILRDLQLVSLKHASWEVPLRLMTWLKERQADGFMNYLYCLCAASRGGQADAAAHYFSSLPLGRGRHTDWQGVSPFNELTVAVAAVAMLDGGYYDALHTFAQRILAMKATTAGTANNKGGSATGGAATGDALTADGVLMAQAADVAALVGARRDSELVDVLLRLPADSVQPVVRRFAALRCLLNMGHLHAPVRLVFDVLGHGSSPQQQRTHRGFLSSVDAAQGAEGTFETRQRGTAERRKHLFIPMAHQRRQRMEAATQLGAFVKANEAALPAHVVQSIAETMVEEGVGAEYMTAALL